MHVCNMLFFITSDSHKEPTNGTSGSHSSGRELSPQRKNELSPSSDYRLLFGNGSADISAGQNTGANDATASNLIHKRAAASHRSHRHPPPGTSVAGSHISKGKGKASTVINVSMSCPEPQKVSKLTKRKEHSTSSNSINESRKQGSSSESSWLGVLSMGYFGTVAEQDPGDDRANLSSTFCPAPTSSWNKLACTRSVAAIEDFLVDLTVDIAVCLAVKAINGKFDLSHSLPDDQFSMLLSLVVAEVSADIGSSFSIEQDTSTWIRAIQGFIDLPKRNKVNSKNDILETVGALVPAPIITQPSDVTRNKCTVVENPSVGYPASTSGSMHKQHGSLHPLSKFVPTCRIHYSRIIFLMCKVRR